MNDLGNVLAKSLTSMLEPSDDALPVHLQPIPEKWVERLFERLAAILGARMADIVAGSDPAAVKREWSQALAGFSDDEIRRGIAGTRTRKFPPNLPEFLHLCRPALDPETAWAEAEEGLRAHRDHQRYGWTHPAVYWAAREFPTELRTDTFAKHRKRWELVLGREFARGAWASPPDPSLRALAGPSQQGDMVDPLIREQALARLRAQRKAITGFETPQDQAAAAADPAEEQA
jgi:hypothetical protein